MTNDFQTAHDNACDILGAIAWDLASPRVRADAIYRELRLLDLAVVARAA
jgi:hypothetical protein